jgi:hypothetical protein
MVALRRSCDSFDALVGDAFCVVGSFVSLDALTNVDATQLTIP